MENDPELNGKYLGTISQDFLIVAETLKEAAYQLRIRKISEYPIFPISRELIELGQLLLGKTEVATEWNYNFSFLEEFNQRNLVTDDKKDAFIETYKNPEEFCCLFVIDGEFTKFIYIPYPED